MGTLEGQVALITGSSRGIGRAIALRLARAGADILVHGRAPGRAADAVCEEIRALGRRAEFAGADIASKDEVTALRAAVRPVLEAGLRWGGTSLDDLGYLLPDGRAGEYTARLRAYGREDEPCRRCGTPIRRTVLRARSSFWCPSCQS